MSEFKDAAEHAVDYGVGMLLTLGKGAIIDAIFNIEGIA